MFTLFYSGAESAQYYQPNLLKSLGGYCSSNPIPNGRDSSLFANPSLHTVQNQTEPISAIVGVYLANTGNTALTNLTIGTEDVDASIMAIEVAAVTLTGTIRDWNVERIQSSKDLPLQAEFVGITNDEALLTVSLAAGAGLFLWIKRTLLTGWSPIETDDLFTAFQANDFKTLDEIPRIRLDIFFNLD